MDYKKICEQTQELTLQVGKYIREERNNLNREDIESKGVNNFVTHVDKSAEEKIVSGLKKIIPQAGFIAEEGTGDNNNEEYCWIIDPIDGTTNFIHGLPLYAISIALMENNKLVMGVVYNVAMDECFYAWKESKAYLNGNEIQVSKTASIRQSLIATGFPYENFDLLKPFMKSMEHFFTTTHGVRRLGSAATDLAYVACGRFEGFYEYNLKAWDVAAGAFLVQQAGGKVGNFKGEDDYLFSGRLIAANSLMFQEFVDEVQLFFK